MTDEVTGQHEETTPPPMGFRRDGARYVVTLTEHEAGALAQVMHEIATLLERGSSTDPAVGRLFPDGYPEDPPAAAEFRRLTEGSLRAAKLADARRAVGGVPGRGGTLALDAAHAEGWLRALTDARLILGYRLNITEQTDMVDELEEAIVNDPRGHRAQSLAVYHYLTFLQETLVAAVAQP